MPDTGKREPASFRIANGRTTVPLHLEPWGTVFVVFRKPAAALRTRRCRSSPRWRSRASRDRGTCSFQANRGAPATITLDTLASWSDNTDAGVKYFSGTGTYTKTIQAPPSWFAEGAQLWLDLGDVQNLAEVSVNGVPLGVLWKKPFRADITGALKPGSNTIEVKVTNLWVNRIIGDRQPDAPKQFTFTRPVVYKANSPLLPSGLLGPVKVVQVSTAK